MSERHRQYAILALIFLGVLFVRWEFLNFFEQRESLASYADRTAVVAGTVADDPDKRATSLRATISVETINGQDAPHGRLLAILPRETQVAYGDAVEVRGLVALPETFETNTGRVFDYPGYLRVRGVSAVMSRAVLRSDEPAGMTLMGPLFALKHVFEQSLESVLPEPNVSLLEGMLLGERGGFDDALTQAFIVTGLIHIVVLSGSNIAIVAEAVLRLLGLARLPRRWVYILGFGSIVLFALMVGGGAATIRAVAMGGIAIAARYMRRPHEALHALVAAAALMVLWNPLVVLYDTGFMLSVLATFGLITLAPFIEARLMRVPAWRRFNLRSIVATTLAVEIFILPALLYTSGVLSLVSLPANALVLPLTPLVMLAGFVTGVLGLLHPMLAFIPALISNVLLGLVLILTKTAAAFPLASVTVFPFPWWMAALVYVPLTWLALRIYFRSRSSSGS